MASTRRLCRSFPLLMAVLFALCATSSAGTNATLTGLITDPTGSAVVGARIQVTNLNTGIAGQAESNGAGLYRLEGLLPGIYRIYVSKDGFKNIVKSDIELHVQDVVSINFAMQVGSVSESITVEGGAPLVNTQDAAVSTVVDHKFVANIPLNGRSFQDLISMTPGVITQNPNTSPTGSGSGGDFSVNGQRTESNYYIVDGVSANVSAGTGTGLLNGQVGATGSLPGSTVLGTTQSIVSVDALQEFRVMSSTYSAEYGRGPGGQFSFVTRAGTNNVHGNLFEFLRNDFFDANDWFNNHLGKKISPLRQNQFGGTLGGPIWIPGLYNGKNRSFFFVSYEGLRLTLPQAATTSQLVPDLFMRQQAPPALRPILNAYALPNGTDFGSAASPSLAQFVMPYSLPSRFDSTSVRFDHSFGAKLAIFFRCANTPGSRDTRGSSGSISALTTNHSNTQTYTLGATSGISNKLNNDFRLGYARSDSAFETALTNFGGATPTDLGAALGAAPKLIAGQIQMQILVPGVGFSVLNQTTGNNRLRQWNIVDTVSIAVGHHQFKTGVDYRRVKSPNQPPSPQLIPVFSSAQQVLTNAPLLLAAGIMESATPLFYETALFVQDEWHVQPRLSLSIGLRWEVDPAPHGENGNDAYTVLGDLSVPSSLSIAPRGTPLWETTWHNLAPRFGAAWTAHTTPGWETVVRGGAGVFFDTDNQQATSGFSGIGFSAAGNYFGASLPFTAAQLNLVPSVSPPYNANVYVFPRHLQLPYTLQWNFGMQQALGAKQSLTMTYVGSAARRLMASEQLVLTGKSPNFTANSRVVTFPSGLTSDYDALQVQFQRSVARGIHGLAAYTWSHCLDQGSSYSALPTGVGIGAAAYVRGNCATDVRHNLEGGSSWDLPNVRGNRLLAAIASSWGLDTRLIARTGFPVPLGGNQPFDPVTGSQFQTGLDLVPGQPIYLYDVKYPGGRTINPAAFKNPGSGQIGNAPRNSVRGFGAWQINMAARRDFALGERFTLQFRAEAFNILNHPNFGRIDPTLSSVTFGQATSMLNQQLGTVSAQYQQGGPRSMQFSLRFSF